MPPARQPHADPREAATCRPWLQRQLELADPALVVTLGGTAAQWALGPAVRLGAARGRVHDVDGRPVVVTYHPSAALRFGPRGAPRAALADDLRRVAELLRRADRRQRTRRGERPGRRPTSRSSPWTRPRCARWVVPLAGLLRAGDLVVLTGPLGAGKTTLTQGIGEGLGVRGPVTSPTFVIARVHPSLRGGPPLVHVDAYRVGDALEVDDLDLDASLDEAVTVVEWGEGKVEGLSPDRLEVHAALAGRRPSPTGEQPREVVLHAVGPRWAGVDLSALGRLA